MNTEAEINLLRDRVRELERSVEKLELPPHKRSSGERIQLFLTPIIMLFGVLAFFGFGINVPGDPLFFDAHYITTERVRLANPDDKNEDWGEIDGKTGTIQLKSEEGSVVIDPTGIQIEGPDGEIVIKPTKPD